MFDKQSKVINNFSREYCRNDFLSLHLRDDALILPIPISWQELGVIEEMNSVDGVIITLGRRAGYEGELISLLFDDGSDNSLVSYADCGHWQRWQMARLRDSISHILLMTYNPTKGELELLSKKTCWFRQSDLPGGFSKGQRNKIIH